MLEVLGYNKFSIDIFFKTHILGQNPKMIIFNYRKYICKSPSDIYGINMAYYFDHGILNH